MKVKSCNLKWNDDHITFLSKWIRFAKPVLLLCQPAFYGQTVLEGKKIINEGFNRLEHANILRFNSPDTSYLFMVYFRGQSKCT